MALQLPDLAQKKFDDIINDLVSSAPKYAENWDNINPSDPAMTLLELMSFVGESTLYRINNISNESYLQFLRLVTGYKGIEKVQGALADAASTGDTFSADEAHIKILKFQLEIEQKSLDQTLSADDIPLIKKEILEFTSSRFRAVTRSDFEELALEATADAPPGTLEKVSRAIVVESSEKRGKVMIYVVADLAFRYQEYEPLTGNMIVQLNGDAQLDPAAGTLSVDLGGKELVARMPEGFVFNTPEDLVFEPFGKLLVNPETNILTGVSDKNNYVDPVTRQKIAGSFGEILSTGFSWESLALYKRDASLSDLPHYDILTPLVDLPPLISSVTRYIRSRKLMATPFEVKPALYTSFRIDVKVVFSSTPKGERGTAAIAKELQRFFDPVSGGEEKRGWPWQRPVSIYEISQIIENIPDVHHVDSIALQDDSGQRYNQLPVKGLVRLEELSIEALRIEGGLS